jgi:uncharacterized membrane protein
MNEADLPRPSPEECSMASLAHALQLVGGFFAPLIILLIRRDSKFVSFHALQALLLQIVYMFTWFLMFAVIMGVFVVPTIMREAQRDRSDENNVPVEQKKDEKATDDKASKADPVEPVKPEPSAKRAGKKEPPPLWFIAGILLVWPVQMVVWVAMMVAAIVYCIKANRGEWAAYPVVGRWAQRLLNVAYE